ncbi:galactoside ABC transporter, permease protein [Escherichia coli]|nr:galactoside transport system permease protein MglC [Escherichia coli TA008]STE50024.1 galactoside ABC transporter, permease protein [Escherichia coli]
MSALNKKSFLTYLKEGGIYVVLLVLLAIIIFQDPTFLSLLNLSNILTQSSVRIIIALGVAGLIVTQGDRSFCWSSGRAGGSGGCDIIAVHG